MSKKSVCIVTWYKSTNCGTCLQAKALFEVIKGVSNVSILSYKRNYSLFSLTDWSLIFSKVINKIKSIITTQKEGFETSKERQLRIDNFVLKSFDLVDLPTGNARKKLINETDFFIVGSDQLWNPYWFNTTYYLDFVKDSKKKKSYATSIGISEIPKSKERKMRHLLSSFSDISVRENMAQKVLSKLLKRSDIQVVVDPTMLLNSVEWSGILSDNAEIDIGDEQYILCYFVGGLSTYKDIIISIAKKLNKKIIIIPMQLVDYSFPDCEFAEAGPYEFIKLIQNASYVCTDSFHAIAFSIIFHRQFTVLQRMKTLYGMSQEGRITEVLKRYGLEKNQYSVSQEVVLNIDYDRVDKIVDKERNYSIRILYRMIGVDN